MRLLIPFILFGLYSTAQQVDSKKTNAISNARILNDSAAMLVADQREYLKAIVLLDQALQIDSNFLPAHVNKLSFLLHLNQIDKALITAHHLNRIKPSSPYYLTTLGLLHYYKNDTLSSQFYFNQALSLYDNILDTMTQTNNKRDMILMNKALNLILIGKQEQGHTMLKHIHDRQKDNAQRRMILSLMNKSIEDIIKYLIQTN